MMKTEYFLEEREISNKVQDDKNFICPRCRKRMQEPRLLPCLHALCSPCVFDLIRISNFSTNSIQNDSQFDQMCNFNEGCPLCNFQLPDFKSVMPPPHYPLQHRLVMDAIRCKLAHRILCDTCSDEVLAIIQCSVCLRNFCSDCSVEHQKQVSVEVKSCDHLMKPLWQATRVRRTALCQIHISHALRYYCGACKQVTCKECIWSKEHRGHAIEDAIAAGRRATVYLITMLEKAKALLSTLLTQYNQNVFSNSNLKVSQFSFDDWYVKFPTLTFSLVY